MYRCCSSKFSLLCIAISPECKSPPFLCEILEIGKNERSAGVYYKQCMSRSVCPLPVIENTHNSRTARYYILIKLCIRMNNVKVKEKEKYRNPYNQIPHLTQDTKWESDKTQENTTYKRAKRSALSQQVTTWLQHFNIRLTTDMHNSLF